MDWIRQEEPARHGRQATAGVRASEELDDVAPDGGGRRGRRGSEEGEGGGGDWWGGCVWRKRLGMALVGESFLDSPFFFLILSSACSLLSPQFVQNSD